MGYSTGLADVLPECEESGNTIARDENVSQRADCRAPERQAQTLDVKPQTTSVTQFRAPNRGIAPRIRHQYDLLYRNISYQDGSILHLIDINTSKCIDVF